MLATLCVAGLTILASLALGAGILSGSGREDTLALAGGVGFAALIAAATVLVRLPGRATTAICVIALLCLAGAWRARHLRAPPGTLLLCAVGAVAVLALLMLPFLAAGHFGPLGVSMDNDLGFHLGWVNALITGPPPFRFFSFGYPLGSESLTAALTRLGFGDEQALIGVPAGALALTAVSAVAVLDRVPALPRVLVGVACGLPYLSAAFFGEASLKEPTMGLLVLTLALLLARGSIRGAVPALLVLSIGALFIFGPPGLVWPVVFVLVRIFADRWHAPRSRAELFAQLGGLAAVLGLLALAALGVAAVGKQIGAYGFKVYLGGPPAGHFGGNFARQLPLTEALGVWFGRDFRLPADGAGATFAVLIAICVFAGAVIAGRRRWRSNLLLPSAAGVLLWLAASQTTLPYFSAKLLLGIGPLLMLFATSAILSLRPAEAAKTDAGGLADTGGRAHAGSGGWGARARRGGPVLVVSVFAALVIWSGSYALRSSPVDGTAFGAELVSLRPVIGGHTVMYLGDDQWTPEWLRGAGIRGLTLGHRFAVRLNKRAGPPWDFDTPVPAVLNSIDFVITTRTLNASSPPANFRLVRTTAHYELWARDGTSAPRLVLNEQASPGARLNCTQPFGRALAARPGVAAVRSAPVASTRWSTPAGPLGGGLPGAALVPAGTTATATLALPAGTFELSLSYWSAVPLTLRAGGAAVRLTPTLEPFGPLWRATVISTDGGILPLTVQLARGRIPIPLPGAYVGTVFAVPADEHDTIVPLRSACGKYVDWYRAGG